MSHLSKQGKKLAVFVVVWMVASFGSSSVDANLVSNGDFSATAASFSTAPGYAAPWSASNPASLPDWTYTGAGLWGVNGTLAGMTSVFGPTDKSATSTWAFLQRPGGFPDAGTLSQVVPLAANSTYSFSYLAAARSGENASGRVTIADNSTTYYDSGSTVWSKTAFQLVNAVINTGASIDGPVVLTLSSTAAEAQSVNYSNFTITEPTFVPTIVNPSFEADDVPDGTYITANPAGWSSVSGTARGVIDRNVSGDYNTGVAPTPDADGEQFAWSNGSHLYQVLDASLFPNTTYTLTVDVTSRSDLPFPAGTEIRLGTGGTFGQNLLTPVSSSLPTATPGEWAEWQLVFETGDAPAALGQLLRVELVSGGVQPLFDNVRLTAVAIPEPASLAILALGGLTMASRRTNRGVTEA